MQCRRCRQAIVGDLQAGQGRLRWPACLGNGGWTGCVDAGCWNGTHTKCDRAAVFPPEQAWPGSEKRATLIQLVDKWRASKDAAVGRAAKALSKDECEAVLQQLVRLGGCRPHFACLPCCGRHARFAACCAVHVAAVCLRAPGWPPILVLQVLLGLLRLDFGFTASLNMVA